MRKLMKRAFAVFIVAVMLLTSIPMSGFFDFNWGGLLGVKASAAKVKKSDLPEDFDLKVYMADVLFRTEGQGYCMTKIKKDDGSEVFCTAHQYDRFLSLISDFQSPATTVYNAFYEDKKFVNSAEAWEAIRKTANPSNAINDLNLQQQYESLIYAVLFDSLCDEKLQKASYSNAITNVTSFTDKLIDKPRTAVMFEKTSLDLDASDELKDTALAFLSNGRDDKWASILEYNGMVAKYSGIIDKILKSATDIYNYINKISMYRALADVGADAVRVLIDMKNATSDEILKLAFQAVIDSMSNDWFGIVDKVIFDVGFSVNMKAVKSLVDYGWKGCCEICPFLKGMAIGEAVGTAACNLLFATEDTIRQYEYMKMIVALENVSRPILKKYENAVKSNNNSSNAAAFWFTVDFISSLYATSANAANEMADICLNKGFVNYLIKICGGNNAERVEECKKTSSALLRNVIYNQKLIETVWENHIAEDYPQFFEKSNEESICSPSKTVKSISVSPKTVYCKAGECPSLPNITTDPADAECTYGFKSDNQDIFSDGTGFSSSQFLPAEKVGEANITVYSLEDPSVSDTFKLIVVSSDEELDKPENTDTESGTCGNGVSFVLYKDTGTLYISGNGSIYGGYSSGREYYANAAWNENKEFIKKVIVAKGITNIGDYAFSNCAALRSVKLSNTVGRIYSYAFYNCKDLTSITIPDSVPNIGNSAFSACTGLTSAIIGDGVTSIGDHAFYGCTGLTSITIPDSVTSIGENAFGHCSGVASITVNSNNKVYDSRNNCNAIIERNTLIVGCKNTVIPNGIEYIGKHAFYGCTGLTSIKIPDSVTYIGESAFLRCKGLVSVIIGNGVTTLSGFDFYGNKNLKSVIIGNSVTSIGGYEFDGCSGLTSIKIPDSVTGIGYSAFYGCTGLTSATIGNSVTSIGARAFNNCSSLASIKIPDSVTGIGDHAFYGCSGLTSVIIGNGVTTLSGFDFNGNKNLKSVIIGNSVTSIGDYAFDGCTGLTSATIGDGVTSIGDCAFDGCTGLTSIKIPDSVTGIGDYAFDGCTGLTSAAIGNGVTSIGKCVFYDCSSLTSVTIGHSVTSIGNSAFENCSALTSLIMPESVLNIGCSAFGGCENLKSVVIPTNVERIEIYSFRDCYNLTSITIPDNVSNIGSSAFEGCYNLKHVFYKGSQHDWNNTVIDENGNYYLINCYVHYNVLTDETINHLKEEITEATCTSSGKIKITCECGYSYIEVIEKLGHTGALVRTIAPTCYAGGYSIYHCDRCDEDYNDDYVDELGHNFENNICTRCGSVVNELNLGEYKTVMVNGSENVYFKFIPKTSGTYYFYSDSPYDTYGYVYDSNFKLLSSNDDGENGCNFCISCTLEADTVYYLYAGIHFIDSSQKIAVCVANSFEAETAHDLQTIIHEACCVEDGEIITKCKNCDLTNVTVTAKSSGHNYIDGVCTLCGWIEGLEYELNDSEEIIITGYSGNVTELKIPSNLSRFPVVGIGENAFSFSCNLTHIFIPSSLKFIADYAFIGCENLLKITVDAENQFYCSDDKGVLFNKDKTALIQYPIRSEQTLYSIPNGVLNICSGAFYNCNRLVGISLPSSIERVNKDVFAECYNLVEVFYSESQNEWSKIAFDEDVSLFLNDRFIHYNVSADEISTHLKKETVSEATCTSFGEVKIVCDCGYSYEIVIPEFGHQKGSLKDIIAPTCTECGYSIYNCIRCNEDYKSDYTEMLDHQGEFVKIVAATCVDDGYTVYHCIRCGEDYKDDFVGTTGHKFENDLCTECGYQILKINLGETKTAMLKPSEKAYYKFIPEESGTYYFYSNISRDCYGYVYDSNMNQLISDDDGGYNANFKISYDFEAGQVYYLVARFYSSDEVGDIVVSISDRFNALTKKPGTAVEIHDEDKIIYGLEAGITSDDLLKCFSVSDNCYIDANNEKLGTGTILSLYSNETGEVIDKYTIILFGDVNGDGWYDGMDAITVSCIANGMLTREQVGEAVWMAADCNHDGVIDQGDVDLLNRAGLLLSSVDQTKSTEELLETSSEYNEYLNLIDQSVEVKDDEPEQESPETQKPSLLEFLLTTIWNYIKLILSLIK